MKLHTPNLDKLKTIKKILTTTELIEERDELLEYINGLINIEKEYPE